MACDVVDMGKNEPIVFDPEILEVLESTTPSLKDFEDYDMNTDRELIWSNDQQRPETLGELIEVLTGLRDKLGEDAIVEDFETGTRVSVFAYQYDNNDAEVRL